MGGRARVRQRQGPIAWSARRRRRRACRRRASSDSRFGIHVSNHRAGLRARAGLRSPGKSRAGARGGVRARVRRVRRVRTAWALAGLEGGARRQALANAPAQYVAWPDLGHASAHVFPPSRVLGASATTTWKTATRTRSWVSWKLPTNVDSNAVETTDMLSPGRLVRCPDTALRAWERKPRGSESHGRAATWQPPCRGSRANERLTERARAVSCARRILGDARWRCCVRRGSGRVRTALRCRGWRGESACAPAKVPAIIHR